MYLFKKFLSIQSLLIIISITLLFYVISLWQNGIYADDSWFGEQAYWLAKTGIVKVVTMKGLLGIDQRLLMYHKLNIIFGALLVNIFGWSVYIFKCQTLFFYVLFFLALYRYFLFKNDDNVQHRFLIALFIIFVNPITLYLSFSYRPEILVMFFGFLSYFFLEKYRKELHYSLLIPSGIFAGLAFFTHPNGLIFPIAGCVLLLTDKNIKPLILFGLFAGVTSSLFFYDLWQPGHLSLYLYQLKNWPDQVSSNYTSGWFHVIEKMMHEHERFFWSYRVLGISLLFLISLFTSFSHLLKIEKSILIYLSVLILSGNIFGSQIAERYLIYYFPYFAIIIVSVIFYLFNEKKKTINILLLIVFLSQLFFCGLMLKEIFRLRGDQTAKYRRIMQLIPEHDALTLVPNEFVFNEIESRNLVVYKVFEYYQKEHGAFDQHSFFRRAKELGIKYVVIGNRILTNDDTDMPFFTFKKPEQDALYDLFYTEKNLYIFKAR